MRDLFSLYVYVRTYVCTYVRVRHASGMSISIALGMSRRTPKYLARTLYIQYTGAMSKQQRAFTAAQCQWL